MLDIINCLSNGEIIEYYEDDYPHPSCLILIKNVTANICEQCREYYLDTKTALNLQSIIEDIKKNKAEVFIVNCSEIVP